MEMRQDKKVFSNASRILSYCGGESCLSVLESWNSKLDPLFGICLGQQQVENEGIVGISISFFASREVSLKHHFPRFPRGEKNTHIYINVGQTLNL